MEQPQQHHQQLNEDANGGSKGGGGGGGSSLLCRQSSTRWTPTTEQIRILKDLYYNYGVRSPSADQIQRISARLRQYGKIEGKNVFYWFQNHKARERQKKRFVPDHHPNPNPLHHLPAAANSFGPSAESKLGDLPVHHDNKYPNFGSAIGLPSSSSSAATPAGLVAFGQMANYGYGSTATMEKNFRNCSISSSCGGGGSPGVGGSMSHNFGWIAVDPYPYSSRSIFDKQGCNVNEEHDEQEEEEEDEERNSAREIETLPLFPMHDNINGFCGIKHNTDGGPGIWYDDVFMGSSRTSLELSLNSYTAMSPSSP
ncbi:protein WUSCHEL [Punica granatum]|uniref:Homeobox domain-containing protein n=2 Tax=Punica granatum TaxID=22663 RepID=A0A218W0T3_PUNGR|nr:protein WUSCHEL [Punica granatum]OWM66437.1 hypothetical protein CDL15_Pgr013654 [Punica granatum]PKI34645.1 hypothetical protein CRG98_044959 [Punica granatum]WHA03965.1 WUSCHEL [Punica granatum]